MFLTLSEGLSALQLDDWPKNRTWKVPSLERILGLFFCLLPLSCLCVGPMCAHTEKQAQETCIFWRSRTWPSTPFPFELSLKPAKDPKWGCFLTSFQKGDRFGCASDILAACAGSGLRLLQFPHTHLVTLLPALGESFSLPFPAAFLSTLLNAGPLRSNSPSSRPRQPAVCPPN